MESNETLDSEILDCAAVLADATKTIAELLHAMRRPMGSERGPAPVMVMKRAVGD